MNFLAILQTIALWCGQPHTHPFMPWKNYTQSEVQKCRDLMFECVHQHSEQKEGVILDFNMVSTCFQSMSFGEFRKPKHD